MCIEHAHYCKKLLFWYFAKSIIAEVQQEHFSTAKVEEFSMFCVELYLLFWYAKFLAIPLDVCIYF